MKLRAYYLLNKSFAVRTGVASHISRSYSEMSTSPQPSSGEPAKSQPPKDEKKANGSSGKKELKILMLHGYTQSGALFKAKTGALNKMLTKAFAPAPFSLQPTLIYPTGPHQLRTSDIPGYEPSEGTEVDYDEQTDNWGWFRRDDATGSYRGLEAGMLRIAEAIREAGGVDAIVGFSQGGAMAALVAAALEPARALPQEAGAAASWVTSLREANGGRALRFCVVYSGFHARDKKLEWLYEGKIRTPSCHFIGSLDTVVEESKCVALAERCEEPTVIVHPGGHYVPVKKEWVGTLVGFLRGVLAEKKSEEKDEMSV